MAYRIQATRDERWTTAVSVATIVVALGVGAWLRLAPTAAPTRTATIAVQPGASVVADQTVVALRPATAAVDAPGTSAYSWTERDVRTVAREHFAALGVDAGVDLVWPPPNHPDADRYLPPPRMSPWVPGAWLVASTAGRWWVVEAYGAVWPADDLARAHQARSPRVGDLSLP